MMQSVVGKAVAGLGAVVVLGLGGLGLYENHEHKVADQLSAQLAAQNEQNQQMSAALSNAQSQVEQLNNKVNALSAANAAAQEQAQQQAQAAQAQRSRTSVRRKNVEDERFKKLQSQVDTQGQAIDQTRTDLAGTRNDLTGTQNDLAQTRTDLSNTRTELSGSIAHTHDELVLLQKRGERNYYEFDIAKSKQFDQKGPVGIRLRKASTKHDFADLDLLVDDRSLNQKHVNIFQPVMFRTPDTPQPIELVINNITKDHIHGYISTSKYKQSELASMQPGSSGGTSAATTAPAENAASAADGTRQKLPPQK